VDKGGQIVGLTCYKQQAKQTFRIFSRFCFKPYTSHRLFRNMPVNCCEWSR